RISHFRSLRPHLENSILGTSRWTVQTLGYAVDAVHTRWFRAQPLVEVSYGHMSKVGSAVFDLQGTYGADHFWSLTLGLRVGTGMGMHRMGRYGVMEESDMSHHHDGAMQ